MTTHPLDDLHPIAERHTIDLEPIEIDLNSSRRGLSWIIDRNPLFLISGVFMLVGCFLVSQEIHAMDPAKVGSDLVLQLLIGLLVVMNFYEFAAIGLGLWLSRTQTLVRDSRHLLGMALLLLVDLAFVYNESGIFSPQTGIIIAVLATVLACIKVGLILWRFNMTPTLLAAAVTAISFGSIYALPVIVRLTAADGFLAPAHAMMIWVGVGLVVALQALPGRWFTTKPANSDDLAQLQRLIAAGLAVLPSASLIGHAGAVLWVYDNAFESSMLSPVLLGLAAVILRQRRILGGTKPSVQAATLMVASAIVAAMFSSDTLTTASESFTWLAVSPLRVVLLAASALLLWGWWINGRNRIALLNPALPLAAALLGHTPATMMQHTRWLIDLVHQQLPTTRLQWGVSAIAAAFGLLIFGALIGQLKKHKDTPHQT